MGQVTSFIKGRRIQRLGSILKNRKDRPLKVFCLEVNGCVADPVRDGIDKVAEDARATA